MSTRPRKRLSREERERAAELAILAAMPNVRSFDSCRDARQAGANDLVARRNPAPVTAPAWPRLRKRTES